MRYFGSIWIPVHVSANESDPPPDAPPSECSTYKYSIKFYFHPLHLPTIDLLVEMLSKHHDYIGLCDKITLLSSEQNNLLLSTEFCEPFAKKAIIGIKFCLTVEEKGVSKMKKQLSVMERFIVREFTSKNARRISSDSFVTSLSRALLNVLATAFLSI